MPRILFIVFLCGLSLKREKQAYRRIYKYNGCKRIHQSERTFIKSIKALAKLDRTTYKVTFRVWLLLYGTSLSRAAAPAAGSLTSYSDSDSDSDSGAAPAVLRGTGYLVEWMPLLGHLHGLPAGDSNGRSHHASLGPE